MYPGIEAMVSDIGLKKTKPGWIDRLVPWRLERKARIARRDEQIRRLKKQDKINLDRLARAEERYQRLHAGYRGLDGVNRVLPFATACRTHADTLAADVYVAHDVLALPAVRALAGVSPGWRLCDAVETPQLEARTLAPGWRPETVDLLDAALDAHLRTCDRLITVGPALADYLSGYGVPVEVIANYRAAAPPPGPSPLRDWCGVGPDARIVLALSTIARGLANVLEAVAGMGPDVHLVVLGRLVPDSYRDEIDRQAVTLGVRDRVHLFDPVPYDTLIRAVAGADVGLIVLDPEVTNNYLSLPNRLFDLLAAGVPVCAPDMPDIRALIERWDCGVTLPDLDAQGWAAGIESVLSRRSMLAANARAAAGHLTWESQEEALYQAVFAPSSVTFLGLSNLAANNRTLRMAESLGRRGTRVTVASPAIPESAESSASGARLIRIPIDPTAAVAAQSSPE